MYNKKGSKGAMSLALADVVHYGLSSYPLLCHVTCRNDPEGDDDDGSEPGAPAKRANLGRLAGDPIRPEDVVDAEMTMEEDVLSGTVNNHASLRLALRGLLAHQAGWPNMRCVSKWLQDAAPEKSEDVVLECAGQVLIRSADDDKPTTLLADVREWVDTIPVNQDIPTPAEDATMGVICRILRDCLPRYAAVRGNAIMTKVLATLEEWQVLQEVQVTCGELMRALVDDVCVHDYAVDVQSRCGAIADALSAQGKAAALAPPSMGEGAAAQDLKNKIALLQFSRIPLSPLVWPSLASSVPQTRGTGRPPKMVLTSPPTGRMGAAPCLKPSAADIEEAARRAGYSRGLRKTYDSIDTDTTAKDEVLALAMGVHAIFSATDEHQFFPCDEEMVATAAHRVCQFDEYAGVSSCILLVGVIDKIDGLDGKARKERLLTIVSEAMSRLGFIDESGTAPPFSNGILPSAAFVNGPFPFRLNRDNQPGMMTSYLIPLENVIHFGPVSTLSYSNGRQHCLFPEFQRVPCWAQSTNGEPQTLWIQVLPMQCELLDYNREMRTPLLAVIRGIPNNIHTGPITAACINALRKHFHGELEIPMDQIVVMLTAIYRQRPGRGGGREEQLWRV
jgi:hypothetical protein